MGNFLTYYIDIIDTENSDYTTALEQASKNSIVLSWQGSDKLDESVLVGSTLRFNMLVPVTNNVDAAFISLFTGDEQRYKVELKRESDDLIIWQGFLLPDSYDEPYKGGSFFVGFEAVDGIGRLRGKYLPEDYYESEKSVIDIVSTCLALTGLQMDLVFAPGIDNRQEKDWNNIYLYGVNLMNGTKQKDAYTILNDIVHDTGSRCYQHLNRWYVEGLNKSGAITYNAFVYDYQGVFIAQRDIDKVVKNIIVNKPLTTPDISMQAPYKKVSVTYNRVPLRLPETIAKEQNDGWVKAAGVVETIYNSNWFGMNGFYAKASAPDYNLFLPINNQGSVDNDKYIKLLKKLYVSTGIKLNFKLKFKADFRLSETAENISIYINNWHNRPRFLISLNGVTLYGNYDSNNISENSNVFFKSDLTASVNFDFIPPDNGLLDIWFYQPWGTYAGTEVNGFYVEELTLTEINGQEELLYENEINSEYTLEKDIQINYADDSSGLSSSFTLAKLHDPNLFSYNTIPIEVIDTFSQNNLYYGVVSLEGANLIADNIASVFYNDGGNSVLIDILQVIYNYENGEQMVFEVSDPIDFETVYVLRYKIKEHTLQRTFWQQWTDSIYNVQTLRYGDALATMYRNLFRLPVPIVNLSVPKMPIMFHDLVLWNYIENTHYTIINCSINFDSGTSNLTISKAIYFGENSLLEPYVDAGPNIYLTESQTSISIDATAYDPDGNIVSYLWEKLNGDSGDTITSPNTEDTTVTGLTGDNYTYKLTVTDNDGLTAFDSMNVVRVINYALSLDEIENNYTPGNPYYQDWTHQLEITPELLSGLSINNQATISLYTAITTPSLGAHVYNRVSIYKNDFLLERWQHLYQVAVPTSGGPTYNDTYTTVFNLITGDDIKIVFAVYATNVLDIDFAASFTIDTSVINNYPGVITNTPIIISHSS